MKIKVLSYNIHKGFSLSGTDFTLHEIKQRLREVNPDIVLLQEVVGENKSHAKSFPNWPTEAQFEFLADSVWPHYSYGKNAVYPDRHHGNVILSKFPIVFFENLDISTNSLEQRGLLHATVEIPELDNRKLHVFNVHLDLSGRGRRQQFQKIVQRARSHVPENDAFILGGDFNDWDQKATPHFFEFLGLHESFAQKSGSYAKSFPSFYPFLTLDRIYHRGLTVSLTTTLNDTPWTRLSDHLPIMAEFEIQ